MDTLDMGAAHCQTDSVLQVLTYFRPDDRFQTNHRLPCIANLLQFPRHGMFR